LDKLLDHVDHLVRVMGEDGVGLGMDFDGLGDLRVSGIEEVCHLPNITQGLVERGYSDATIRKILGENFLRVFREVL
jgi:membrane dipeptidase